jgi:hypothetical protein
MKPVRVALAVVVLVAFPLVPPGCSSCGEKPKETFVASVAEKAAEQAIEKETGQKADVNIDLDKGGAGQVEVTTSGPQGQATTFQAGMRTELPADFPKDLPIYAGATPTIAVSQSERGVFATLQAPGTVEQVKAFYKERMKAEGWSIESEMTIQESIMLGCKKGNRSAMVNIGPGSKDQGGSVIVLSSETIAQN